MRTDQNVASGDLKLAALMRQGVTVAHIVLLLQEAFPKHWQQHLRNHLGATRPTDLTPAELAEFTDHVLWLVKQTGMRDPAAVLVLRAQLDAKEATAKLMAPAEMADIAAEQKSAEREPVALKNNSSKTCDSSSPRPVDLTITTENPFGGREHDGRVFRDRHERNFFIGRLSPRQREEWLRDHPERWQTREEFLRDLQARSGTDVEAKPPEVRSTKSINEVLTSGESDGPLPVPREDKRLPDKPATNTTPPTIGNAEAAATADDEIIIGGRRLIGERRVAKMLGRHPRTLERWRTKGKGPAFTTVGRKVFYEPNDLQEWIDRRKIR